MGGAMGEEQRLATVLKRYMDERAFSLEKLAVESTVQRTTLQHWLKQDAGVQRPYGLDGLLKVAQTLRLQRAQVERLLRAAHHPPFDQLHRAGKLTRHRALLRRVGREAPNNLEAELNRFVGREDDTLAIAELFTDPAVRLVTLTGPGGSGKTRLALRAAKLSLDAFSSGVYFVDLAPLDDHQLVVPKIAQRLGLSESAEANLLERLLVYLRQRRMLLVLDSFEHVADAAPLLSTILRQTTHLTIVATSRVPLHLTGEVEYPVPPLPLPRQDADLAMLLANPAVDLFQTRAKAVQPAFALNEQAARAVAAICTRLDGLPLAIELAAARCKRLTPQEILTRFPSGLDLGSGGPVDVPPRLQSLRETIEWSDRLLSPEEQRFFARLAVFVGGWPASAADICILPGEPATQTGPLLESLTEQHLIRPLPTSHDVPRYGMLDTIREYALEQLYDDPALPMLRERHADWCVRLLQPQVDYLPSLPLVAWLDRAEGEHDNLRAALTWALTLDSGTWAARLAGATWPLWERRWYYAEGNRWLLAAQAKTEGIAIELRARLLIGAATIAFSLGDIERHGTDAAKSMALWVELDEPHWQALAWLYIGTARMHQGDQEGSHRAYRCAETIWREQGNVRGVANALANDAYLQAFYRHFIAAQPTAKEARDLFRQIHDIEGEGRMLNDQGLFAMLAGDYATALRHLREALAFHRATNSRANLVYGLCFLGLTLFLDGSSAEAMPYLTESIEMSNASGLGFVLLYCLFGLAGVASRQGDFVRAACLSGAALALQATIGATMASGPSEIYEQEIMAVYDALGEADFNAALAQGAAMTREQVIALALSPPR